ncbi:MAG TPA: K(+)-transporting ATPase subunit F [Bryobacteraceae bacterium]|nr:K(+)-transporting ATPase subunit F [Bryobacteraceae bacterium]
MRPAVGSSAEDHMEYLLSLIVAVGVGVYLFYALLRPERF